MILDFSAMQENVVPHFKGGKGDTLMRKQEDVQGKILQLTLPVGSSIGQHVHEDSYEVMYILSGSGVCYDEGQEVRLLPGGTRTQRSERRQGAAGDFCRGAECKIRDSPALEKLKSLAANRRQGFFSGMLM